MKRILLAISLVSFAAQAPLQAESKVLAMIIKPEHKQMFIQVGSAIKSDAKMLAAQGGEITKEVLSGAETALRMPFEALSSGTKSIAAGLKYLKENHPLVGAALCAGLCIQSIKKCNEYDRNQEGKAFLCFLGSVGAGIATAAYGCAAICKYTNI